MKLIGATLIGMMFSLATLAQSVKINGKITNEKGQPLASVNVFIEGSIDGATSEENGSFAFETSVSGEVKLVATAIGYKKLIWQKPAKELQNVILKMSPDLTTLKEVEITAGSFQVKGSGNLEKKNAVDLVTVAGSEGDLYKSIEVLPGAQTSGVDGKLEVRGGSSVESQTFIDDMHVMTPYSARPENTSVRGNYSPFIFDQITFSMGGFSPEYSQSLSSVQPLQTKDDSKVSKIGLGLLTVGGSIGGTQAWQKSSTSFEANYTNVKPYMSLFHPSQKSDWNSYFSQPSFINQTRINIGENGILKAFVSYGKTLFNKNMLDFDTDKQRALDFTEDNLFATATFRNRLQNGWRYFAGIAYSLNKRNIENASVAGDSYYGNQQEIHMKSKAEKRFSYLYKLSFGVESYLREYHLRYQFADLIDRTVRYSVPGIYVCNDFNLSPNLILNASGRLEYTSNDHRWNILPRLAMNYQLNDFTFSAATARYQQAAENDYLIYNKDLHGEKATQYILSVQNSMSEYTFFRVEGYYKKYDNLLTGEKYAYSSDGFGYSRGIDLMFKSGFITGKNQSIEYMLSYSFNDTKRKYFDYKSEITPSFVSRNTASGVLKYTNMGIKSIFGLTNRYADGRTYTNPNLPGEMNARTSPYNSLDFCWTFLASKKVLFYSSANNLLGRNNIFGYLYQSEQGAGGVFERTPIVSYTRQGFLIGCFITLGGKTAYDASKF